MSSCGSPGSVDPGEVKGLCIIGLHVRKRAMLKLEWSPPEEVGLGDSTGVLS